VRELPPAWRRQALEQIANGLRVRDSFREGITWSCQDVRTGLPLGPFDLALCRNLAFTYFDDIGQAEVLRLLVRRVRPGGFLVLGKHEMLPDGRRGFGVYDEHLRIYRRNDELDVLAR
jgi:chemotaxis protein methyltransferase CheR